MKVFVVQAAPFPHRWTMDVCLFMLCTHMCSSYSGKPADCSSATAAIQEATELVKAFGKSSSRVPAAFSRLDSLFDKLQAQVHQERCLSVQLCFSRVLDQVLLPRQHWEEEAYYTFTRDDVEFQYNSNWSFPFFFFSFFVFILQSVSLCVCEGWNSCFWYCHDWRQ